MDALKQIARQVLIDAQKKSYKPEAIADLITMAILKEQDRARANPSIEIGSIMSARTKQGMVEITVCGVSIQIDIHKSREVEGFLRGAIEAATSDQIVWALLKDIGLSDTAAGAFLLQMREQRQGSTGTVYAS